MNLLELDNEKSNPVWRTSLNACSMTQDSNTLYDDVGNMLYLSVKISCIYLINI